MINFPEIDLKNEKVRVMFFLIIIFIFFLNHFDIKTLVSIIIVFIIINNFKSTKKNLKNHLFKDETLMLNYNNKIENILKRIKKYKKISPYNFKEGMYNWVHFLKNLDILEDDTLFHYNPYFDKAYDYLIRCVNSLQALGTEAEELKYIDAAKYNEFINSKGLMEITADVRELYEISYEILYNLSLRLNEKWKKNPNTLNKEIVFVYPLPYDKTNVPQYNYYG